MPTAVVLGARNLGGAIATHLLQEGWAAAAVARSEDSLERMRSAGALALQADASNPGELADALLRAREQLGGLDLVVNAVSAARPPAHGAGGLRGGAGPPAAGRAAAAADGAPRRRSRASAAGRRPWPSRPSSSCRRARGRCGPR